MNDDETPGGSAGSGRLWTDPREEDEHTQWLAPRAVVQPPPDAEPPGPPDPGGGPRPILPSIVIGLLLAFVLIGGGVLVGNLLNRDDDRGGTVAALPAAPGAVAPDARSRSLRAIYASASPSVVYVRAREGVGTASGTGFLIDSDGTIVTNAHVVAGSSRVQVRFEDNGDGVDAEVMGSDASSDLAVLRVDASDARNRTPLALADSDQVEVGDVAVAIGFPLGLDRTLTAGIVSAVDGSAIRAPNGFSIDKVIQTDAPINPGNSGGPLLDAAGRVIGVNSQIATAGAGGGNVGIGFAVPSNTVRQVVPQLRSGGSITRPYLGITSAPSTVGGGGAQVADVIAGGPADAGGLRIGDVVRRVGGQEVTRPDDISAAIASRSPGDRIEIEVRRGGQQETLRVRLGTRPESIRPSPGP